MKHFTSVHDVDDMNLLAASALQYKQSPFMDKSLGLHKRVGLLFMNPSMRTRISTQIAASNLGMEAIVFNVDKDGWKLELEDGAVMDGSTVEHLKDAAPVLGMYFDILCVRTFPGLTDRDEDYSEVLISKLKEYTSVPVVSLESSTLHPLQSFADMLTIKETFQETRRPKIVLTWAPHIKPIPQCVANSFAQWMNKWDDVDLVITHPEGYELATDYSKGAVIEYDRAKAFEGADYIYVKNWSSYGSYGQVLCTDNKWMPTLEDLKTTNNARLMHCLPLRRNVELSDEVLDSPYSIVTRQAGNRVWAAQAVLADILKTL